MEWDKRKGGADAKVGDYELAIIEECTNIKGKRVGWEWIIYDVSDYANHIVEVNSRDRLGKPFQTRAAAMKDVEEFIEAYRAAETKPFADVHYRRQLETLPEPLRSIFLGLEDGKHA